MHRFTVFNAMLLLLASALFSSCSHNSKNYEKEERGMFSKKLRILSQPTKARIYINEEEIGETPLTYKISHEQRRMINIKAVPLYPNQYTQNIFLMVPPIPKTMTIYMNHFPEDYDRSKDTPLVIPEKPLPEVIIETQIDTVYVEHYTKETEIHTLPIIYFDTDSFALSSAEEQKLKPLLDILSKDQSLALDIYGFADSRASEKHNLSLSLNRAGAVKAYLVQNGIAVDRLSAYGHGKISKVTSDGLAMDLSQSRKVLFLLRKVN